MSNNLEPISFQTSMSSTSTISVLGLRGELDFAAAPFLLAIVDRELPRAAPEVIFDLDGLAFVDVAGARALLRAVARTREAGRTPAVVSPTRPVERLLRLLGVAEMLDLDAEARSSPSELQLSGA